MAAQPVQPGNHRGVTQPMPEVDRRAFLVRAAAVGGALTLGFDIPFGRTARADDGAPEITAWIVIAPDDRVTIRIARAVAPALRKKSCEVRIERLPPVDMSPHTR